MKTAHKVWMYFLITVVIWAVARVLPSVIYAFSGNSIFARAIFMLLCLPAGWYLSCKISKGRFSNCIKANLYIFCVIEGSGLLNLLPVIMELSMSTGQYSVDAYGIPYADYPSIYGPVFLFIVAYLAIGIYLAKMTAKVDKFYPKENNVISFTKEQKKAFLFRPLAWVCTCMMALILEVISGLICQLGIYIVSFLSGMSTATLIITVLLFGGIFTGLFFYSAIAGPSILVMASDAIYPSNHAVRYFVIGIIEIGISAFLIFSAVLGIIRGDEMFWFYARYIWIVISSGFMMVSGNIAANERHKEK